MTNKTYPKTIKPHKLAEQEANLNGQIPLGDFAQLIDLLADSDGFVDFDLNFKIDESRRRRVSGQITTQVQLDCQRCFGAFPHKINTDLNLAFVKDDMQARQLPDSIEGVLLDSDSMALVDLIQEELMLNLPTIAMHSVENCREKPLDIEVMSPGLVEETSNPFEILKKLKEQN